MSNIDFKLFPSGSVKTVSSSNQYLPYFLLNQHLYVLVSSDRKYFNSTVFVDKNFWAKFFTLGKLTVPTKLPVIVDGIQYNPGSSNWVIQYNLTHLLSDNRCSVYTILSRDDFSLLSTSATYRSSVWLERELSDFTGINFIGLLDTRRLLLDYFEQKMSWQTHINNDKNFNEVLYDITLSY